MFRFVPTTRAMFAASGVRRSMLRCTIVTCPSNDDDNNNNNKFPSWVQQLPQALQQRFLESRTEKDLKELDMTAEQHEAVLAEIVRRNSATDKLGDAATVAAKGTSAADSISVAAFNGHVTAIKAFAAAGADVNKTTGDGTCAVHVATQAGNADCVTALADAGADVNVARNDGSSPVYIAAQNGHVGALNALIAAGGDVNRARDDGATPMLVAAKYGHADCINALADAGVDLSKAVNWQFTASGHPLPHSLRVTATPVYLAAQNGHSATVKALAAAGADVNAIMPNGATAMLVAAQNGHAECVTSLADAGADVNQVGSNGATPMLLAAQQGHVGVIRELLRVPGIDKTAKTPAGGIAAGSTALDIARRYGHDEVAQLLQEE